MTSNVKVYPGPILYVFTVDQLNDRKQSNYKKAVKMVSSQSTFEVITS